MTRQILRSIMLAALAAGAAWAQLTINITSPLPTATIGTPYSQALAASGGTSPYQWAVTAGKLPDGLSISGGAIQGTPLSTALTETFTLQVTDSASPTPNTASGQFTLPVALAITTLPTLPVGTVGVNYSQTLTAIGGSGTYTWAVTVGSLPSPLLLNSATGAITGQPATAATSNFTIQATDSNQVTATLALALTINPPLVITTTSPLPTATVGVNYSQTLAATGGSGTYTWAVTVGSLPSPLLLNSATGAITGQPATAATSNFTIQVTDTNGVTAAKAVALTINPALVITTTSPLPQGTVGVKYSQTLAATGGSGTYTWAVTVGSLPSPLLLDSATGAITGQPATAATSNFTIQVTDTNGATAAKAVALTINPALVITTTSPLPQGTVGVNYSQTLTATGGSGTYTWAVTVGSLPSPLLLDSATGAITGQPATAATSNFTIQVTDTNGVTATLAAALTVNPALVITTASPLPAGAVGVSYSQTLAATGGSGTYTWAVTVGSLPSPLLLNSATGAITGQPATAATSNFTIQVTDTNKVTATKAFALTISPALAITTTSPLPAGTVGVNYSQTLTATGGSGTYTWALTVGSLPSPLLLNSSTGAITGQPSAAATSSFTIQVTDSNQITASVQFALTIDPPLAITTSSPLANGTVNGAYNQSLVGTGGLLPYTWSLAAGSSPLPPGLTLTQGPASTGVISGTANTVGTFPFKIQLSDSTNPANTITKPFAITVGAGVAITTSPTLPNATVGTAYLQTLAAAGGVQPYTWSPVGALPAPLAALSLSAAGTISGTPTAAGTASFTVTVTDFVGGTNNQKFTLTIVTAPVITTTSLPNGTVAVAYSQTLAATGGTSPYTWAVASGSLPSGLSLSTAGAIAGKPSATGTSSFTVQLTDATGVTASQKLTLTIVASLTITTPSPLPTGEAAIAYSQKLAAAGGTPPYTWSLTGSGALPSGLTLSASGLLAGTPAAAGTFNFTVQATDSNKVAASTALALTIAGALAISTPAALSGGSLNSSYSQALAASAGVGPYTWTLATGSLPLPPGLTISPAGVISGVPTATGTFSFAATVADSLAATASRQFTIVVAKGLTITTSPTLPGATVGVAYSEALQAAGGTAPYTWSNLSGSLPPGLSVGSNGSVTGVPTAAGSYSFTVLVVDSLARQASLQLSLAVAPALSVSTSSLPGGTTGAAYSQSLAATGGTPPYTWSLVSGALPGGLTLSAGGSIAGTANAAGSFSFTVQVADSLAATATKKLSIAVAAGLSISTAAALPNASINVSYSQTLAAAGGAPPYTWALTSGALPAGLTLNAAGAITGTPTAAGPFQFTATVTDSAAATASQQFTLSVGGGLAISTTTLPGGTVGASYSQTLTATGGVPPYVFTTSAGSLPPGITLAGAVLGGTPTKTGPYTFTIQVTDSVSATATQQFIVMVGGPLPGAAVGTAYSQSLSASGSYTWAVTQGALPDGLSLGASSGTISGTPTAAGAFTVTIQVTGSANTTASAAFTLTVIGASFSGLSSTATSDQQLSGSLALSAGYPPGITGTVTLAFQPDASLASPAVDPSILFSNGTTSLPIASGSTTVPILLQTGTVAGTITLTATWNEAGGAAIPAPVTQTIQIAPAVPVITAVTASTTSSGFQVVITGYSNTREAVKASLQFTSASGQTLQPSSLDVPLATEAQTWFQSSTSDQYGSQFTLTLPFNVTSGSASAIGSISVQLVNSQGTSTSASAPL